ncbi:hypothetical protein GE061_006239 [Apolygus lucorum]|uniref:Sulfite oxidase n=1 Tax=Apolygus lucorum TaxID=248454 RepID=A0A6A4JE32_APOLU|nr:hypothetical protein GE061_006239 [Apolygus lucorum]
MNPTLAKINALVSCSSKLRRVALSCYHYSKKEYHNDGHTRDRRKLLTGTAGLGIGLVVGVAGYHLIKGQPHYGWSSGEGVGERIDGLPTYKMVDVGKHTNKETRMWITYKEGVYDITDFIESHPGGNAILMGVGGAVDPFWNIYAAHKTPQVARILEQYRIGNLDPVEAKENSKSHDPYSNDPNRNPELVASSKKPFNAEPPPKRLVENYITPTEYFYVRNHLPVPLVDLKEYEIEIEGPGIKSKTLTLEELKQLPKHTITATVMCAGNRRSEMSEVKEVKGLFWGPAAIGNATWTGAKLCDILNSLGYDESNKEVLHVQFEGLDLTPESNPYGGSIPIEKAVDPRGDVILAYEMNGQPLTRDHGYPVRVIAPGIVGARCVKWLHRIVLSNEESPAFWQRRDYKGFSPNVVAETANWEKAASIEELPVISAICVPSKDQCVPVCKDNTILVTGYAWSGGGRPIVRVDVTADGGNLWVEADLVAQNDARPSRHWGWTLWEAKVPVDPSTKKVELWAKAVDSSYNVQPESFKHIWNIRGVLNNAYHRVTVTVTR